MAKIRGFYSYPIYDSLSPVILDELIYYDFIHKFYEIFDEETSVNFVTYSLNKKDLNKIKEIAPYARLIHGEKYTEEIGMLIKDLFKKKSIGIKNIRTYYCSKCDEYFKESQVKIIPKKLRENIAKIRVGKKIYFLGAFYGEEEPIGVYLGKNDSYVIAQLYDEEWIAPASLELFLLKEIEIPKSKIKKVGFEGIKDLNFELYVIQGDGRAELIKKGDIRAKSLKRRIPSYSVIFSKEKELPIKTCPICGNVLQEENVPILVVKGKGGTYDLSSPEGSYKLPVLYCPNCGHIEYGTIIKECPVCGNIMERRFSLKPELSALGAYIHSFDAPPSLMFLHQKRFILKYFMENILKVYGKYLFKNTRYLSHKVPESIDEVKRAALLIKKRGTINKSDIKKIRKLRNVVDNIVRYVEIYGTTDDYKEEDEWLLWKNNEVKKRIRELVENGKISYAFHVLYGHIIGDISHFYIPIKRKTPLVLEPVRDAILMLYPFMPAFVEENLGRINVEKFSLSTTEAEEISTMEIIRDFVKVVRKYREKKGIPRKEPLKKVVFVTSYADEVNSLKSSILNLENVLIFQVVEDWDEMEIEIEPNMEEISASYRAWAPKIGFLLRRKNVREVLDAMEKGGYTLGIEGFIIKITPKMINYIKKVPEGYDHIEFEYGDIYIQNERDATTKRIRLVREVIRRINIMRKDIDMDFDDLIDVSISGDSEAIKMIRGYDDEIREKCLARNIEFIYTEYGYIVEWPIMGYRITIGINPLFKRWVIKAFKSIPGIDDYRAELLFKMGYGSIYELMEAEPEQIAEATGMPLKLVNELIDYLYSTAFKPKKEKNKEYCPFCGTELTPDDDFCPRCGAPIRVKMEERKMKKGNVYLFLGELGDMLERIPEELMKEKKLLITKDNPDEVKKLYNLKNTETVWISYVPFGDAIKPKDLEKLKGRVLKFLEKGGKLIIADCFDLLLAINGLDKLLQMIGEMKEKLKEKEAYLFFTIEELEAFEMGEIMKYVDGEVK